MRCPWVSLVEEILNSLGCFVTFGQEGLADSLIRGCRLQFSMPAISVQQPGGSHDTAPHRTALACAKSIWPLNMAELSCHPAVDDGQQGVRVGDRVRQLKRGQS